MAKQGNNTPELFVLYYKYNVMVYLFTTISESNGSVIYRELDNKVKVISTTPVSFINILKYNLDSSTCMHPILQQMGNSIFQDS
jgi:hypothetical protein